MGNLVADEQQVRTMAGWVGVEISKSRVRTPGKAGYGLYRVRGSVPVIWPMTDQGMDRSPGQSEPTLWTAYAFTLGIVENAVRAAIERGTPTGPGELHLVEAGTAARTGEFGYPAAHVVPTRWTSAYTGRRDLGVTGQTLAADGERTARQAGSRLERHRELMNGLTQAFGPSLDPAVRKSAAHVRALRERLAAGIRMTHVDGCLCDDDRYDPACVRGSVTERQVQRIQNAEFQREHLRRRRYGLVQRYTTKMRLERVRQGEGSAGDSDSRPHRSARSDERGQG